MADAPFYSYEPSRTYRRRQARQFEVEARLAAYNDITRRQIRASGGDPDLVNFRPTMFDRQPITGRDVDDVIKAPHEEKKGGGWGILGKVAGAVDDAAATVFGGEVREPWDVLRRVKQVMDAENRYISAPIASKLYETVSGQDYEDAPGWLRMAMETLASPTTYVGGALGGTGKVANLLGRGAMSKRAYAALVGGQIVGGGVGATLDEELGTGGVLGIAGSLVGGGLSARMAAKRMGGPRAAITEGDDLELRPGEESRPPVGEGFFNREPLPGQKGMFGEEVDDSGAIKMPAPQMGSQRPEFRGEQGGIEPSLFGAEENASLGGDSPAPDLRESLTAQQQTISGLQANVDSLTAAGAPRRDIDEARRLLNEAKREKARLEEAIGAEKRAPVTNLEEPAPTATQALTSQGAPLAAAGGPTPPPSTTAAASAASDATPPGGEGVSDAALRRLVGGKKAEPGLTTGDAAMNKVRRVTGLGVEEHEIATPIMREREDMKHKSSTLATRLSAIAGKRVRETFEVDGAGRITNIDLDPAVRAGGLPNKPTIQDLAARLPLYDQYLNDGQRKVLTELRTEMAFYSDALVEQGVEFGSRADVMEGGFYLPRGAYEGPGSVPMKKVGTGTGLAGSKKGFQKEAEFGSMVEGIESGGLFEPFEDAIKGYAEDAAEQAIDSYTAKLFKGLTDESGELIGRGAASRVPQNLRKRVDSLRARISSARETAKRREVVAAQAAKEFERIERSAKGATGRASASEARRSALDAAFTPEDLNEARQAVTASVSEGRTLAREIGENVERLRQAKGALGKEDKAILGQVAKLNAELDRADAMTGNVQTKRMDGGEGSLAFADNKPGQRQYADALKSADRISRQVDALSDHAERMAARVDSLAERGEILGDLDDASREGFVTARRTERELLKQDRQLAAAKREIRILQLEERRAERMATSAGSRASRADEGVEASTARQAELQAELDGIADEWQAALVKSRQVPEGQSAIGFTGLQGTTFPVALANAANKYLRSENQPPGVVRQVNNLLRGIGATGDASFIGIQGLLTAGSEPGATAKAWATAAQSLRDPDALAKFIELFDARAVKNGTPNSREWLKAGLQLGGSVTEHAIATRAATDTGVVGAIGRIESVPGVKQSNRAFGVFGDSDRLGAAEAIQRAHPDWPLDEVAQGVNLLTGWTKGKFLGDAGEYVQFAPRFFQSQLEMLARGLNPMDRSPTAQIARKALMRLVAVGSSVTVGMNQALGNETVLDPRDPNFMRIRVGGEDVSLFGTWDSLLKATIRLSEGDPGYMARSKASPLLSKSWDLMTGRSYDGPSLDISNLGATNDERLANFAIGFLPFGMQNTLVNAASGEVGLGDALGFAGVKSSPLTKADRVDQLARSAYGKGWDELSVSQLLKLSQQYPDQISMSMARQARAVKRTLEPYFAAEDQVWDKIQDRPEFAGYDTLDAFIDAKAESLRKAGVPEGQVAARLQQLPIVKQVQRAVSEIRRRYRMSDPEIDAALVDWYGAAPLQRQRAA